MALTLPQAVAAIEARSELRPVGGAAAGEEAAWLCDGEFHLHLAATADWVQLATPVPAVDAGAALEETFRRHVAKLARTSEGRLLLEAELPQEGLDAAYLMLSVASLRAAAPACAAPVPGAEPREVVSESEMLLRVRTLTHEGWHLKRQTETNRFSIAYLAADERRYQVEVGVNESWATFQVALREAPGPLSSEARRHLEPYLLRMNHLAYWAKLGMVGDQVVLSLDLPADCFDLARFRAAARTVGHYALLVSSEVQILSQVEHEPVLLEHLDG
jgi:hypothetical protein